MSVKQLMDDHAKSDFASTELYFSVFWDRHGNDVPMFLSEGSIAQNDDLPGFSANI